MPIPDLDLRRIQRWVVQETSPEHVDELRVEADVTGSAVTIVEVRPTWDDPDGVWTKDPVARLRYKASTGEWSLWWRDRHLRFHRYDGVEPTRQVQMLLDHVADSGD